MARMIDYPELFSFVKRGKLERYSICMDFPGLYQEAEKAGDLEIMIVSLEIVHGLYYPSTVKVKSTEYGREAGYVLAPGLLKGEIVQKIPHSGWVLSVLTDDP